MRTTSTLAILTLTLALTACGGGGDDAADPADPGAGGGGGGGGTTTLSCNTANYTAGAVSVPTLADLAGFAGTFVGEEGSFDMAGTFTKSGDATMVLGDNGTMSYKGVDVTPTSFCMDNVAGPYGKLLYVEVGDWHFDIATVDAGDGLRFAWGVVEGGLFFRNGVKQ
jgi:hypothetical protein